MTTMTTESTVKSESSDSGHRIVVGIDGSDESLRALDWAAVQAGRAGAVLEIETAYEPSYEFITRDEVQLTMERRIAEARARVAEVAPSVSVSSGTHIESPAKVLIEASQGADLLVVGSRGLGGFQTSWHRSGLTPFVLGLSTTSGP
jgi:nucleotide-binding universal stress UspA family protein